jgi:hypothetical protein
VEEGPGLAVDVAEPAGKGSRCEVNAGLQDTAQGRGDASSGGAA